MGAAHRHGREGGLTMDRKKTTTPKISRKVFLVAVKELEEVLDGKRTFTEDTKAASKVLAQYVRQLEADVRAKRKEA